MEKPPPPVNETHKKPQYLSSSDSSTEGEEEVQGDNKDNASGDGKEVEEDEATVVDTDDKDSPPGGRCFRCRGLCSINPVLKTIRVDGKLRMFDPRCYRMFKAGIEPRKPGPLGTQFKNAVECLSGCFSVGGCFMTVQFNIGQALSARVKCD